MMQNILKDIRKIYTSLDGDTIRAEAWRDLKVGLLASGEDGFRRMEAFLAPLSMPAEARRQALRAVHASGLGTDKYDFVLCEPGIPVPRNGYLFESDSSHSLASLIVAENPDLELAMARTFPLLRESVAERIIHRTSRENALFSLVTALPNVIPNLFELPWAVGEFATDTAFLTMSQVRMALRLAAAYGRPVGYAEQKFDIAAIVAGAFGWRAIARELIGKIPLGGGLIPKAAVAFAGTYVVGLGLEKVNRTGSGFTKQEKRDAYAAAFTSGKEVATSLAPASLRNS
jgi:uncharacterized protein (DUF697 family)